MEKSPIVFYELVNILVSFVIPVSLSFPFRDNVLIQTKQLCCIIRTYLRFFKYIIFFADNNMV